MEPRNPAILRCADDGECAQLLIGSPGMPAFLDSYFSSGDLFSQQSILDTFEGAPPPPGQSLLNMSALDMTLENMALWAEISGAPALAEMADPGSDIFAETSWDNLSRTVSVPRSEATIDHPGPDLNPNGDSDFEIQSLEASISDPNHGFYLCQISETLIPGPIADPPKSPPPQKNTKDKDTSAQVVMTTKKRKAFSPEGREKVKRVRQDGACVRCRLYKESCDSGNPCKRCNEVQHTARNFYQPCYRERLEDIIVFRAGNSRAGEDRSEFKRYRWANGDNMPRRIVLRHPYADSKKMMKSFLQLECRRFNPREVDVLEEPFKTSSGIMVVRSPPVACIEAKESVAKLEQFIIENKSDLLNDVIQQFDDEILLASMQEAVRYGEKHKDSAVSNALNIRAGVHFGRRKMVLDGSNVLDLEYFDDKLLQVHGLPQIPAILDFQIDTMAIKFMLGQTKLMTKKLKKLIFKPKSKKHWYEIYLCCFVLISCLETVHQLQMMYILRYAEAGSDPLARATRVTRLMVEE